MADVAASVHQATGLTVKPWFVARVLRRVMHMKYKRPKKNPYAANLDHNLVLRFLFAKKMFELGASQARLFNIDESWLNDLSWNQRQWQRRGQRNTVQMKAVRPRLSLILCIDNRGAVYWSLCQANTNHDVFQLFATKLA